MNSVLRALANFMANSNPAYPDTRYHRTINAFWRLPRIFAILSVFAMFAWSLYDADRFAKWADAIAKLPPDMWTIVLTVVVICFGIKKVGQDFNFGGKNISIPDDDLGPPAPPPAS